MPHPLIPKIIELATPVARSLGLDVVDAAFHTHHNPPVLRIDIHCEGRDVGLDDCEAMSHALETTLDETDLIPDAYILEISSPGITKTLSTERDFISFKGFPVTVTTTESHRGKREFTGQLVKRDEEVVQINQKGRAIAIPRNIIHTVQFAEPG